MLHKFSSLPQSKANSDAASDEYLINLAQEELSQKRRADEAAMVAEFKHDTEEEIPKRFKAQPNSSPIQNLANLGLYAEENTLAQIRRLTDSYESILEDIEEGLVGRFEHLHCPCNLFEDSSVTDFIIAKTVELQDIADKLKQHTPTTDKLVSKIENHIEDLKEPLDNETFIQLNEADKISLYYNNYTAREKLTQSQ